MARPKLVELVHFLTTSKVAKALGIQEETLLRRIAAGMYPPPTAVNDEGVRLFSPKWLERVGKPQ